MNKRLLKKQIAYTCGELAAATIFERDYIADVDYNEANKVICRIADLQCETIKKCSFSFDKAPRDFENGREYRKALAAYRKAAYNKINEEFNKELQEIVKAMNALVPAERRKEILG